MDKSKVLRQRSVDEEAEKAKRKKILLTQLNKIIKKDEETLTQTEIEFLEENDEAVQNIRARQDKGLEKKDRMKEWEEDIQDLKKKCSRLADAISRSRRLVVYTGAGISTSANIPDYRGPNGVWTLLDQGKEVAACDLGLAQPTLAHMALFMLHHQAKISHIVSQNCDGLHLRSGIPRNKLSEVHGNMFIEVCKTCKPVRPYVRLFDVTERTNRFRHSTMRRCYICGSGLMDTIVHFGERGSISWPINWNGASRAADKADMILCLGSSLKVLRRYPWLWCMDRPVKQRPPLYIVNLQWTPKDSAATLKLNGRCDFVMSEVLKNLGMRIPEYTPYNDPLLSYATHLNEKEEHTTSRRTLIESKPVGVKHISMEARISDNGVIKEVRVEDKFTWLGKQFESRSRSSSTSESSGSTSGSVKDGDRSSSNSNKGSSGRTSRDSKSSSNQSSNSSSSTTSRNSSSSRSSETDTEMESNADTPTPENSTEDKVANTLSHENSMDKEDINHTVPNNLTDNDSTNMLVSNKDPSANPKIHENTTHNHLIGSNSIKLQIDNSSTPKNANNYSSKDHNDSDLPKFFDNTKEKSVAEQQTTTESLNGKASVLVNGTKATVNVYINRASDPNDYDRTCNGFDKCSPDLSNNKESHGKNNDKSGKALVNGNIKNGDLLASTVFKNGELFGSQTVNHEGLISIVHINGESANGVKDEEKMTNITSVIKPSLNGYNLSSLHNAELNLCHNPTTNGTVITHSKHTTVINTTSPSCYTSLLEICQPVKPSKVCQDLATSQNEEVMEIEDLSSDDKGKNESDDDILICTVNEAADTQSTVVPAPTKVFESNSTLAHNGLNPLDNKSLHKPATESNPATAVTNGLTEYNSVKTTPGFLDNPAKNVESMNFTEITIKTDAYTNGCDNNLFYSQGSKNEPGFHSPPYSDHTYASPPHKLRKEDTGSPTPIKINSPLKLKERSPEKPFSNNNLSSPMKISNEKLKFSSQVEFKTVIEVKNEDCKKEDVNYTPKKTDDKINGVVDKAKDDIKIETLKVEVKEEGYEVITIDSDDEPEIIAIEVEESTNIKEEKTPLVEKSADNCKEYLHEKPVTNNTDPVSPTKNSTYSEKPAKTDTDSDKSANVNKDSDTKSTDEQESTRPRSSRYGLRENRGLKYHGFREDLLFKEQMIKALQEESEKDKKQNGRIPKSGKVNSVDLETIFGKKEKAVPGKIRDLEYRTIKWPRDALYFSYEPNCLYLVDGNGYVCDCCDPKTRRRGGGSSEDNSEAEITEILEDDGSATEEGDTSYQEEVKVHAPGWFGKGRRKRGKTK